jgi:hypothetical protein
MLYWPRIVSPLISRPHQTKSFSIRSNCPDPIPSRFGIIKRPTQMLPLLEVRKPTYPQSVVDYSIGHWLHASRRGAPDPDPRSASNIIAGL